MCEPARLQLYLQNFALCFWGQFLSTVLFLLIQSYRELRTTRPFLLSSNFPSSSTFLLTFSGDNSLQATKLRDRAALASPKLKRGWQRQVFRTFLLHSVFSFTAASFPFIAPIY